MAVMANGKIKLGYLIVLGIIRVEVIFPVKLTVLVDLTVYRKAYRKSIFHHLLIKDRKGTGHTGADRTGVSIWRSAEFR